MKKLLVPTLYSQRDLQWANTPLGYNTQKPYTIGNYGCLLTVATIYLKALGLGENPLTLNTKLKQNNGFVNYGEYVWDALTNIYSDIKLEITSPRWDTMPVSDTGLQKMRDLIDQGRFLLTEVDFNPNSDSEEMHFVGVYGYDGDTFYAIDPWTGTSIDLSVYGGVKRAVISYHCYNKPLPFEQPQATTPNYWQQLIANNPYGWSEPKHVYATIYDLKQQLSLRDLAISGKDAQMKELQRDTDALYTENNLLHTQADSVVNELRKRNDEVVDLTEALDTQKRIHIDELAEKDKECQKKLEAVGRLRPVHQPYLWLYQLLMQLDG